MARKISHSDCNSIFLSFGTPCSLKPLTATIWLVDLHFARNTWPLYPEPSTFDDSV